MERKHRSNITGFTLIELLVVATITILLSGISIAYYGNFNEKKKIENDTQQVISMIELIKRKSIAGDKSLCTDSDADLPPYELRYYDNSDDLHANNLILYNECASPKEFSTLKLKSNDVFRTSGNIIFKILEPGIVGSEVTITIQNTSINKCEEISVGISGVVEDSGVIDCT